MRQYRVCGVVGVGGWWEGEREECLGRIDRERERRLGQ